ncbi:MAG: hypothetical protein ACP5KU_00855 [Candidatus Bathyarchaeia archaeon]
MFEDFWLSRSIPVVVRFAGLPKPSENSSIEICGTIDFCNLEGGFYYLNAECWAYAEKMMPEFQPFVLIPTLAIFTLLLIIRKNILQIKSRRVCVARDDAYAHCIINLTIFSLFFL